MSKLIRHIDSNYTVIGNSAFRDSSLSLKAKGLLCQMLSLPDDWEYSIEGLTKLTRDGKRGVASAIRELEEHGYVKRIQSRKGGMFAKSDYLVSDTPMVQNATTENATTENATTENATTENATTENATTQNVPQLNTNISNTKELSTKELSTNIYSNPQNKTPKRFVKPTLEEIKEYVFENNLNIDCEYFFDYYNSNGWMVGRNHMKNWKATLRNWSRKNAKKATKQSDDLSDWIKIGEMLDEQDRCR